jgi:hypothetical protein
MRYYFFLFLFISNFTYGQTTWSNKIAKIVYENCTECHRTGGIAPFKLESYADAQAQAFGIKVAVGTRSMPPWPADPNYNHLKGERILTTQEISDINDWVSAGAPSGDLSQAPALPSFPNGIKMQNPDKSIGIPVYSVVKNTDDYRCFTIPSGITADKFLSQIEFEPKNLGIVHHILLYQDVAQTCKTLDDNDPLPGYSGGGGGVGSNTATLIGGWVPGGSLIDIPSGMAIRVKANSYYIMQVHYAPGSMSKKDSTKCYFKYSTLTSPREVFVSPILNHIPSINGGLTNGPLFIPANTVKTFNQVYTMDNSYDFSVISVAPHMHLIGKQYTIYAVPPTNDTMKLCHIPNWDFHWQGAYTFQKIKKFPKNTKIYGIGVYDNTTNNIYNPSNPPKNVSLGEGTTDEMMLCYFTYTLYYPGDENIILDSAILNPQGISKRKSIDDFKVYPNPVNERLHIELGNASPALITIMDVSGKVVCTVDSVETLSTIDVSGLAPGIYLLRANNAEKQSVSRFVKY